jgi:phenylpropionate dioxygenase-like ring-hydroxylating dioxygenase large terminal subunit
VDGEERLMAIDEFIESMDEDLQRGVFSPRVFGDRELHEAEMDRIFTRCWVFVGHVSEIPEPGDYVVRKVGEDNFILVRDEGGEIAVLLNHCPHRGAQICRADKGNTSHFRCPYHGWIFKNSGDWNGAPKRAQAYRKLDRSAWGMARSPHTDTYQGLVFTCLDPDAEPLEDYLGDMRWYLDLLFGLNAEGMRTVGDPQRWVANANWKSGAENFVGDAYHVPHLHRSVEEAGAFPAIDKAIDIQAQVDVGNGHGLVLNRRNLPEPWGVFDYPPDVVEIFELDRLDENQRTFVENYGVTVFTIFPNLSFIRVPGVPDPTGMMPTNFTCIRQWQPNGAGQMEIWNWPMVWNAAPAEFNDASVMASVASFSSSGVFEQDDTVVWTGPSVVGRSPFARRELKLNLQLGSPGMSDYEEVEDWCGPGFASTTVFGEIPQISFWRRWREEMMNR